MLCACYACACACLVAMEEDVAILGLEQLEEESAAAAAVRGPALVKSLGLLGHVPAEGQRRRLAWAWPRTLGDGIGAGVEKGRGRERSGWRGLGLGWFCWAAYACSPAGLTPYFFG